MAETYLRKLTLPLDIDIEPHDKSIQAKSGHNSVFFQIAVICVMFSKFVLSIHVFQ